MSKSKFSFVHVSSKTSQFLNNKSVEEYLMKWSLKNRMSIQYFNFNEQFNSYQRQEFVEAFFKDSNVYSALKKLYDGLHWAAIGETLDDVTVEAIHCSVLSLEFFDRIYNNENKIVHSESGHLVQCFDEQLDNNIIVGDRLRIMLLQPENEIYNLYTESERNQFLFQLFKFVCIGGQWCQYEDNITPYIDTTKLLYKDLLRKAKWRKPKQVYKRVERVSGTNELVIRSVVIKVTARNRNKTNEMPENSEHPQNFFYLIIDPFTRTVTTLYHQYGGCFI